VLVGSPAEVVEKILFEHELFRHQRFLAQLSVGPMRLDELTHSYRMGDAAR